METNFLKNPEEDRLNRVSDGFRRNIENEKKVETPVPEVKAEKQSILPVKKKNRGEVLPQKQTFYENTFLIKKERTTESTINIRISRDVEKILRKILFAHSQTDDQRISVGQFIDNILEEHTSQYKKEIEILIKKCFLIIQKPQNV